MALNHSLLPPQHKQTSTSTITFINDEVIKTQASLQIFCLRFSQMCFGQKKHVWSLLLLDIQKCTNCPGTGKTLAVPSQDFHCARPLSLKESADLTFIVAVSSSSPTPCLLGLFFLVLVINSSKLHGQKVINLVRLLSVTEHKHYTTTPNWEYQETKRWYELFSFFFPIAIFSLHFV